MSYSRHFNWEWANNLYREECWNIWSTKYRDINPIFMIRMGYAESCLRHWVVSEQEAYGPWQIQPASWSHLLWIINDGKLAKVVDLNKKTWKEKCSYFQYIPYNFEMSCIIMRYFLKKYKWDYEVALLAYLYGDSPGNYQFNWRKNNMWYWRKEPHYKRVFGSSDPWWLYNYSSVFTLSLPPAEK